MAITAAMVKELRDKTGAGMMDCKKALTECEADVEKALDWLRQKGLSKAAKRADRATSEGVIASCTSADGSINRYQKKEILLLEREMQKLEQTLGGIKNMDRLPQLAFIIDPNREDIAVKECRKLGIPIVAVTDTNCDPDVIDYIIPGNDDAIRAIKLFVNAMAEACIEGAAQSKEVADPEAAMQQAAETAEAAE